MNVSELISLTVTAHNFITIIYVELTMNYEQLRKQRPNPTEIILNNSGTKHESKQILKYNKISHS